MKIAMICSEANPLSKTGGLADVTYSLTKELNKMGHDAIIILPLYKKIKEEHFASLKEVTKFDVFMSWRKQYAGVYRLKIGNTQYYLIDNEYYFKRDNLYGYNDDGERFAFFSLASIYALMRIEFIPDIIHVHDWQAGMIPCLIKERFNRESDFFIHTRFCLTIHNPAFKGYLDKYFLNNFFGLSDTLFDNGNVRFDGQVSTLKSAITYADVISTVSPTHRNELLEYSSSHGLNYILKLREQDFVGILNGIDTDFFSPETDPILVTNYTDRSLIGGKSSNKKALLKKMHLPYNKDKPVFAMVTRLTWQKGIELVLHVAKHILDRGAYLIVLGSGEKELEQGLENLRAIYQNNVGIYIGYNEDLAHLIYAGSDFFIMPSLFEPCGLGQMIAMRYGSLPIVRETGGLKDTVEGFKPGVTQKATGFSFVDFNDQGLLYALTLAIDLYFDRKDLIKEMIKNGMREDNGYVKCASAYVELYKKALAK